jgi:RHS repeat-associated protein
VLDSATAPVIGYDDYDPWGYPLALRTKAIPNAYLQGASKYKFTGMVFDDDYGLNLHHTPFRPYDGLMGRWVVMDPLANNSPDLSPYHYARNNPLSRIDLLGLDDYYYNREGERVGVVETDEDDRYFIQDAKGEQSYKDNKYVQFTGDIFNATDAEGGEGKVVAVVAGEEEDPPTPEDAVTLGVGGQTDNTRDWDFYTIDGQTFKVPTGYHVIITPSGEPKVIYTTGWRANLDSAVLFGLLGPRKAYAGESFLFGLGRRDNEVAWVNDITRRVSERKPELKPFIRPTR